MGKQGKDVGKSKTICHFIANVFHSNAITDVIFYLQYAPRMVYAYCENIPGGIVVFSFLTSLPCGMLALLNLQLIFNRGRAYSSGVNRKEKK